MAAERERVMSMITVSESDAVVIKNLSKVCHMTSGCPKIIPYSGNLLMMQIFA